jgi:hypothetical protein
MSWLIENAAPWGSARTAVLWQGRPLADAEGAGEIAIEGSRSAARRFLRLFPALAPAVA